MVFNLFDLDECFKLNIFKVHTLLGLLGLSLAKICDLDNSHDFKEVKRQVEGFVSNVPTWNIRLWNSLSCVSRIVSYVCTYKIDTVLRLQGITMEYLVIILNPQQLHRKLLKKNVTIVYCLRQSCQYNFQVYTFKVDKKYAAIITQTWCCRSYERKPGKLLKANNLLINCDLL